MDWQNLRNPKILRQAPKEPPFYHEENGKQVEFCDMCHMRSAVLDMYDRSCRICHVYVCKHPKCVSDFRELTTTENYGSSGGYWEYTKYSCEKSHEH
jgi:hypothetical protein